MRTSADPVLVKRLSVFASAASVFSVAIGLSVLAGRTVHFKTLLTWGFGTAMAPNAAACTVLGGMSLWLLRKQDNPSSSRVGKFTAQVAAAIVGLAGLLTLAERLFNLELGIDRLLIGAPTPPSAAARVLMSPIAAGNFLLFGLALLTIDWRTRRGDWPAQFLCLGAATAPAFGLLGLLLGPKVSDLTVALPAVVSYFLLTSGLVCSRASWALGGLLTSRSRGAQLLRRTAPSALLVLSLIGWFISKPLLTDAHFTWVEVSALAVFSSLLLSGFIAWIAFIVERGDAERERAETALNIGKEQLDRLMDRGEQPESERRLLRKVNAAFAVALLLTGALGMLSWHNAQRAAEDADWVAHTHEVSTTLELTLRHLLDVETGGRGFALTGDQQFLEPYETGKSAVGHDLQALRLLVADNPAQERRLDVLVKQTSVRIEVANELVSLRQRTGTVPTELQLERGKQIMDAARAAVEKMEAEEARLLGERSRRARTAQHFAASAVALGSVLGVVFLSVAGFTVSREIDISARARTEIKALNADLERRVAQRTAALGESEGRLAGVIQSAMDAILTVDEQQNIMMFNGAAEKMFRCPAAEALGQPVARFIPQRFHAAHVGHIHKFADTGVTNRTMGPKNVLWAVRADGQEFQIEASISQVVTGGKKLFTVILRDVTERKQAEERLRKSEENYRMLWDSMDEAFCAIEMLFDQDDKPVDYRFLEVNPAFAKQTGMENAQGRRIRELQPQQEEYWYQIFGQVARTGQAIRFENEAAQLHRWFEVHAFRVGNPHENKVAILFNDITERKRADQALSESHARLKKVLEVETVGVMFWDLTTGALMDANSTFLNLMGYSRREVEARELTWQKLTPPEYLEVSRAELRKFAVTGRVGPYEKEYLHKDGTRQWFVFAGSSLGDNTCVEFCVDISDRKKAEEALQESEDRFRTLIEQACDAFFLHDGNGRFLEVNRQACESLGYTREELLRMRVFDVEQEMDIRKAQQAWEQAEPGKAYTLQGHQRRKDGTAFPVEVRLSAYYIDGQKLHLGLVRDTTERKRAEDALRESEERFRALVTASSDVVYRMSPDWSEMRQLSGRNFLADTEAPNRNWLPDYIHPDDQARVTAAINEAIRTKSIFELEHRVLRVDGSLGWTFSRATPLQDANGEIVEWFGAASDVTERKRAEEVRERLAAIVDSSDDAIISKTLDGTINAWNRGAEKIFGYPASEVVGKPMLMLFPPDRVNEESDILARIRRGESVEHFETVRVRKDGARIDVSVTISPIKDSSGAIVGASKIARDITERKQVEEALRRSDATRGFALATAKLGEWELDLTTLQTTRSLLHDQIFGYPSLLPEWTRSTFVSHVHPDDRERVSEHFRGCMDGGKAWDVECRIVWANGNIRWVWACGDHYREPSRGTPRMYGIIQDITERKQAEEVLQEQARVLAGQAEELSRQAEELVRSRQALESQTLMLQSVLDSMAEGLVAADEQGKFILWNIAATRIVGMGAENVPPGEWNAHYGVYLPDTVTPLPTEQNPLSRAIQGEVSTAEIFLRNSELEAGTWIEISGSPLKDGNGALRGGVVAFRDITQRKIDEREIRKLNEELEERVVQRTAQLAAANHELEAFTYSVSHDLRAPLRHIGGFSKILSEDFGSGMPAEAQSHLKRIEDGVHHMGLLVDELLNLARVGRHTLHLQATELNSVIEEVVSLLQPEVAGRAVTWKIARLPSAECDPVLVRQVFQNLLANALKFTRTRDRAVIEVSSQQKNGQTVIAIGDNGVGFNMKYQDKLFGVFQRLHRAEDFEGTGIGLATVQRIVRKHGGRIWAEAELDKGATFYFTLGAAEATVKAEEVKPDEVKATEIKVSEVENKSAAAGD
jgi:PAS domain S-box-containing protein